MFGLQQTIPNPCGITVFGSHTARVAPDVATIRASVSSLEREPALAYANAERGAQAVQNYLRTARVAEFGTSRAALTSQFQYTNGANTFIGYQARISFRVALSDLEDVQEIVAGMIGAGANEIEQVSFATSKLQEARAEACRMAIAAARVKAIDYCGAAGVLLGPVIHIEDVNLDTLTDNAPSGGGLSRSRGDGDTGGLDPSLIEVKATVIVAYAFAKTASETAGG